MNYQGKIVAVSGADGFIGKALTAALQAAGANIIIVEGDVREPMSFAGLDHRVDYFFHFADPSSQVLFKRQPLYAADVTLKGFINAAQICRQNGIKLIYPSTGLLSQGQENEYARCKKLCEDIHLGEGLDAIGIRIFATYGPGEGHKRDFASVPYLFARDMVEGKSPVIFGDGEQTRDFIYIDDVVQAILHIAEECNDQIIDVGSGEQISFNTIIEEINALNDLPQVKANYIDKPVNYVDETLADPTNLHRYYEPEVTFAQGIKQVMDSLK